MDHQSSTSDAPPGGGKEAPPYAGLTSCVLPKAKTYVMLILSKKNQNHSLATQTRVANELVYVEENDNAIMRRLENVAKSHDLSENEGKCLECYVIFEHATSLWLLQTVGLPKEMEEKIDVFATTMEDWLAKMIFLKMPNVNTAFPPLDRVPISLESETTVHLVVFGFSAQSEALVMNAASCLLLLFSCP